MPNHNRVAGLVAQHHLSGGTPQRLNEYTVAAGDATAIYAGDLVKTTGSGRAITQAAPGDTAVGVFAGCRYRDAGGEIMYRSYYPASQPILTGSTIEAFVADDPNQVFAINADAAVGPDQLRDTADIVDTGGSNALGRSGVALAAATLGTGSQLKVLGPARIDDNPLDQTPLLHVVIADHELGSGLAA